MVMQSVMAAIAGAGVDVIVNDPTTDTGNATTQNETALEYGNGVLCAGFNDGAAGGNSGWANSNDLGANWTDQGVLNELGDPVIAHHVASDTFYYASLGTSQIRINASTDGCTTWGAAVNASTLFASTTLADKPWIAVDNNGGANDGNIYLCWTRFNNAGPSELRSARSTDGGATFISEAVVTAANSPFGCNIEVNNDSSIGLTWADRSTNDILFRRSTDSGVTYPAASQMTVNSGAVREPGTDLPVMCDVMRPTLNGNIRQIHQSWMAMDTTGGPNDGNIYVVWATDPAGATDNADVFFSVSGDNGANWSNMLQMGAGGGLTDQFEPNLAVADNGDVIVAWYDRRNDVAQNMNIDVYTAFSTDGGATFQPIVRVTDQSFGVPPINPPFNFNNCYMGEYISVAAQGGSAYYLWGDNRNTVTNPGFPTGRPDPDVWFDSLPTPSNVAPVVTVNPAAGNEGAAINLTGTVSDGDGDFLFLSWTVTPDAGVDAGASCLIVGDTTLTPTITCSDNGTYTATLTATGDAAGAVSANATVTVGNVDPAVVVSTPPTVINEGDVFQVAGTFSDPGWNDTYTGSINWDFPLEGPVAVAPLVTVSGPPIDQGTIGGSRQYGDNGSFTVTVAVSDDNGGSGSDTVALTVNNVAPTAAIDETGTILVNGVPTFLANAGEDVDFSAQSTDPGSDDLLLRWDWDDGPPSPDVVVNSLVNPPGADPLPSPSVQPRDVTNDQTHAFGDACRYDIVFDSTDDDGGTASDTVVVLIVGNDHRVRSAGYWTHQYRGNGRIAFTDAELECYLAIVDFVSQIFSEVRPASTFAEAVDVLRVNGTSDMAELLDRQLLAALLNFANGSVAWDQLIDTDGDNIGDTAFSAVIAAAEVVRANLASTRAQLEVQKDLLEDINLGNA